MATDVDVQYFSHQNGLTLGNNWGDLIRMLDKTLVAGIDFTQITAVSIDEQGDVHITLYAAHNAMLLQLVELTGFLPNNFNQKYRIKGVPSTTQLILKPKGSVLGLSILTTGTAKLAPLGYEIVFRDTGDIKRVYRAKNPTAQHPFIRIDETISDGINTYTSTYAKSAMVGLLESMSHIDDYNNSGVLQLPFDPADPKKNWKITGTGSDVVRGWSRWHWRRSGEPKANVADMVAPGTGNAQFTLVGDSDAFYFLRNFVSNGWNKILSGCGLLSEAIDTGAIPPWFLMAYTNNDAAGAYLNFQTHAYATPLISGSGNSVPDYSRFIMPKYSPSNKLTGHTITTAILSDWKSGYTGLYEASPLAALEIPISDTEKFLRGTLKHICYDGNSKGDRVHTTPLISGKSMYVRDVSIEWAGTNTTTGFYFYLGELE